MELKSLIAEAMEKSPEFKAKYEWRVVTRNRAPDLKWLMPLLEESLGTEYVMHAANLQIAKEEKAKNDGKDESEGYFPEDAWARSEADEINPG